MKTTSFVAAAVLGLASTANSSSLNQHDIAFSDPTATTSSDKRVFSPVSLPGGHYIAGSGLFPANVIAGYNAPIKNYTSGKAWGEYILKQCLSQTACTSTVGFNATNSGSSGGRYWFGYTFRGGPVTTKNYTEYADTSNATAYTIVLQKTKQDL